MVHQVRALLDMARMTPRPIERRESFSMVQMWSPEATKSMSGKSSASSDSDKEGSPQEQSDGGEQVGLQKKTKLYSLLVNLVEERQQMRHSYDQSFFHA